ncbi:MAG: nicotinate mononucleotide-dependent phosphoribosyltransferase CobT [Geitlerinemataceae cyanobacterium]
MAEPSASLLQDGSIAIHAETETARAWCDRVRGRAPLFGCVTGFTATATVDNISAAGLTPRDRLFTANADLEFLSGGHRPDPRYPLPPLVAGASPVLISRAIAAALHWPIRTVNAGLAYPLAPPAIDLGQPPALCVSSGRSLDRATVEALFLSGLELGQQWSQQAEWLIVGECVVGGTTAALGVLTALGIEASELVGSSQRQCDRALKQDLVRSGLEAATRRGDLDPGDPLSAVAAVGDPMQPVVAGIAIGSSVPVLLAGGTQMLTVWKLGQRLASRRNSSWSRDRVAVGTTRWVVEDGSAGAIELAEAIGAPLLATGLDLSASRYESLRAYERGFVKEGVGAGGAAIGATLHRGWGSAEMVAAIDALAAETIA